MVLILDNYDSFTYNLVQRIGELGCADLRVLLNDDLPPAEAEARFHPTHIIISPGPGTPSGAGHSCDYIRHFHGRAAVLGVCLGHQAIAQVFGGRVVRAERLMHGKTSLVRHDGRGLFERLANPLEVMRYHSLLVDAAGLDKEFFVTARTEDAGELMGIRSTVHPTEGVQFHPESFLTDQGHKLLANFLKM